MSEIDDKKRYWLWGELDAVSHEMLKKIQLSVNKKLVGPTFDLHLTLSGPFYDISQDRLNRIESFSIKNKQLSIKSSSYQAKDLFFQSLFIEIEKSKELTDLKNQLDHQLGLESELFYPHISLFYGLEEQEKKQLVIDHLPTINEPLILDKISIVEIGEGVESWKILYQYPLIKDLYAFKTIGIGRPI